jgi:hypothetical protein
MHAYNVHWIVRSFEGELNNVILLKNCKHIVYIFQQTVPIYWRSVMVRPLNIQRVMYGYVPLLLLLWCSKLIIDSVLMMVVVQGPPLVVWGDSFDAGRGSQRDVVYLGRPIAPCLWAQVREEGGWRCGVAADEYSCIHMEPKWTLDI